MYISNLKLWNFRKYGSINEIELDKPDLNLTFKRGLNVLIGENDSGKTAIIDAIKLVLKTHSYDWIKVTHEDFNNDTTRFRIEIEFRGLIPDEAKNFTEWLGWETVTTESGDEKCKQPFLRLIYDVSRNINDWYIIPSDVRAGVDDTGYPLTAEAREYLKATYLKPLRDAQSELIPKRNSRLAQILQGHEAFKGEEDSHILVKLFNDFNLSVEKYFEGKDKEGSPLEDGNKKGKELKDDIDKFIQAFYGHDKESNFGVVGNSLKNILEKLELSLKDEINPGLGTLNRLFMSSELLHLQKKNWNGIRLGLIEELEAHLHPQAQMKIIEYLQKEDNIQLILTTHSPNLGSKVKLENLIICNNSSVFPMGAEYTELDSSDYTHLERFLDVTKANLFFAKGVVLVEGWAEEILLPSLARYLKLQGIIQKDFTEAGVSVVNIGNTGFSHYSKVFLRKDNANSLNIPVSIITDVDVGAYTKTRKKDSDGVYLIKDNGDPIYEYLAKNQEEVETETSTKMNEIIDKLQAQEVDVFVAPFWTLEYSLFKSSSLNQAFCKTFKKIHPQVDEQKYEEELAKKLINKGLKKTDLAYELAKELENDQEIKISESDTGIKYLIDAIKYVCDN